MGLSAREWLALWRWDDLSPDEKPHLRYPSVWRWFQAEGVPCPLTLITDPGERKRRQREYGELWRYLFVKHLAGLPEDEQQLFRDGQHPSQSHDRVEAAEPVAARLRCELAARGIAAEVSVARYPQPLPLAEATHEQRRNKTCAFPARMIGCSLPNPMRCFRRCAGKRSRAPAS